jgi:molybdate transport system substrate-binding protein
MKKLGVLAACGLCSAQLFAGNLTVSGAASLKEYLETAREKFVTTNPETKIDFNMGASGTLKKQVVQGAPVDIVFFASKKDVVDLKDQGFVDKVEDMFENSLVVIRHKEAKGDMPALGDPGFVPAGKYSKEALTNLGTWTEIEKKALFAKDVRSVLNYVERGEADWGIVYKSDAKNLKNSYIEKELDKNLHSPIIYSLGIIKDSTNKEEAQKFVEFLKTQGGL